MRRFIMQKKFSSVALLALRVGASYLQVKAKDQAAAGFTKQFIHLQSKPE